MPLHSIERGIPILETGCSLFQLLPDFSCIQVKNLFIFQQLPSS